MADPVPSNYRLTITGTTYSLESEEDFEGPHHAEEFVLQFVPIDGDLLPLEDYIFIKVRRHSYIKDSFENRVLSANESSRQSLITDFAEAMYKEKGLRRYRIVNSIPVPFPSPLEELEFDFPIIPYTSLNPGPTHPLHWIDKRLVTYGGKVYVWKHAYDSFYLSRLGEELGHYQKLKGSRWIAEIAGIVVRQGLRTGFLVQYYPKGDLTKHFDATEVTKRGWLTQVAQALIDFSAIGFYHRRLKCANIIVDDDNNVRIIDLDASGISEGWAHPDDYRNFVPDETPLADSHPDAVQMPMSLPSDLTGFHGPDSGVLESNLEMQSLTNPESTFVSPSEADLFSNLNEEEQQILLDEFNAFLDAKGPPLSGEELDATGLNSPTDSERQKFQIYSFGKTAWELFAGCKVPTNEDDLKGTPGWVQTLVHRCCKQEDFDSMEDILRFLESLNNEEMGHGEKPGI